MIFLKLFLTFLEIGTVQALPLSSSPLNTSLCGSEDTSVTDTPKVSRRKRNCV